MNLLSILGSLAKKSLPYVAPAALGVGADMVSGKYLLDESNKQRRRNVEEDEDIFKNRELWKMGLIDAFQKKGREEAEQRELLRQQKRDEKKAARRAKGETLRQSLDERKQKAINQSYDNLLNQKRTMFSQRGYAPEDPIIGRTESDLQKQRAEALQNSVSDTDILIQQLKSGKQQRRASKAAIANQMRDFDFMSNGGSQADMLARSNNYNPFQPQMPPENPQMGSKLAAAFLYNSMINKANGMPEEEGQSPRFNRRNQYYKNPNLNLNRQYTNRTQWKY